eukprot:scaffold119172_cov57-Phaeocystis_antarctica.AAC.3
MVVGVYRVDSTSEKGSEGTVQDGRSSPLISVLSRTMCPNASPSKPHILSAFGLVKETWPRLLVMALGTRVQLRWSQMAR